MPEFPKVEIFTDEQETLNKTNYESEEILIRSSEIDPDFENMDDDKGIKFDQQDKKVMNKDMSQHSSILDRMLKPILNNSSNSEFAKGSAGKRVDSYDQMLEGFLQK